MMSNMQKIQEKTGKSYNTCKPYWDTKYNLHIKKNKMCLWNTNAPKHPFFEKHDPDI